MDKITLERLAPKGCKLTFSCEHKPEVLQIFCAQILHQNLQITLTEARVTYFTSLHKKKTYKLSIIFFDRPPSLFSIIQRMSSVQSPGLSPHNAAGAPRSLSFRRFFCPSRRREDER